MQVRQKSVKKDPTVYGGGGPLVEFGFCFVIVEDQISVTVNLSYLSDYSLVVFFDLVHKQNIDATFCLNWVGQSDSDANRLHNQGNLLKGVNNKTNTA